MFDAFDLAAQVHDIPLHGAGKVEALAVLSPARLVPVLGSNGARIEDTLAIAETLAERHPQAGHWPEGAADRATARWLAAKIHSGFPDLRAGCPRNLRLRYSGFSPPPAARADVERTKALWGHALRRLAVRPRQSR